LLLVPQLKQVSISSHQSHYLLHPTVP
jgi:hypothetical protein